MVQHGKIIGIVPKTYLPNYAEFYEKRWFASARDLCPTQIHYAGQTLLVTPARQIFRTDGGVKFGIEICEDIWAPIPPSNALTLAGVEIMFNLSASTEQIGKHHYLESLLAQQSARTISAYVYSSCGFGESSQDVVFGGNAFIYEKRWAYCQSRTLFARPSTRNRRGRRRETTYRKTLEHHFCECTKGYVCGPNRGCAARKNIH